MLVFMAGALLFLPSSPGLYRLMGGAAVLFGGAAAVLVAVATRPALGLRLVAAATRPLPGDIGERVRPLATSFFSGLAALGAGAGPAGRGGALLRVGALSGAAWLLEAGMYFTLMFAFPLVPSLALAVLTTAVANLGTLIPSSPGYVGVFDFLGRSVLTQFGTPQEVALAYILVVHAALVVPISLLGLGYAAREGGLGWLARAAPRRRSGLSLRGTP
jgi:glycosyltransferase 2 family protein